ncbi:MAG TPA: RNB domain-containing ribonuclease, partial [Acidobacteriota bacterium]|nr:RNB domain-containing ribonuclease [Acidobacteriota bacterium]
MGQRERILEGRLVCHRDGYGFVIPESDGPDIFIAPARMKNAVHGDRVQVRWWEGRDRRWRRSKSSRPEGEILKVLSRGQESVIGKVFIYRGEAYLAPLDKRYHYVIWIPDGEEKFPVEGMVAAAEILAQPTRNSPPTGRIIKILGQAEDPDIQYRIVCQNHQIPVEFPQEVLDEAGQIPRSDHLDLQDRIDYRNELTVTIDGETARDFDDAVALTRKEDGSFLLKVHIADVSHYVRQGSAIDMEALVRGTSVYFPDRAIPMLPEVLSNDICS